MSLMFNSNQNRSPSVANTLERLRVTTNTTRTEWFDILQLSWIDYQLIRLGRAVPTETLIARVAEHFNLNSRDVLAGNINYSALAMNFEKSDHSALPEIYSKAAFGRMRTSISSVNFLEKSEGWRLRLEAMRKLKISESALQNPFAPISMKFITDLCEYLRLRQFQKADFFAMGAYTFEANKSTLIAKLFSEITTAKEAYEFFFNDCMRLFEQNCTYKIKSVTSTNLVVEYLTNADVAAESGIRHLGNASVCQLKCGLTANVPRYIGHPPAKVKEVACVHAGDDVCRLEVDFSPPQALRRFPVNISRV